MDLMTLALAKQMSGASGGSFSPAYVEYSGCGDNWVDVILHVPNSKYDGYHFWKSTDGEFEFAKDPNSAQLITSDNIDTLDLSAFDANILSTVFYLYDGINYSELLGYCKFMRAVLGDNDPPYLYAVPIAMLPFFEKYKDEDEGGSM